MKHSAVMAPTTRSGGRGDERRDHELGDGANGADEPGFLKKGLEVGRFLGPAHPTGCVPGARGAFIPVGLGVPSHPCRLAGSAGVRPGALDVRQSQPARPVNDVFRRIMPDAPAQAAARAAKDRRNERDRARRAKRKRRSMRAGAAL